MKQLKLRKRRDWREQKRLDVGPHGQWTCPMCLQKFIGDAARKAHQIEDHNITSKAGFRTVVKTYKRSFGQDGPLYDVKDPQDLALLHAESHPSEMSEAQVEDLLQRALAKVHEIDALDFYLGLNPNGPYASR